MKRVRADVRVVELGLADTRAKAQALILAGSIYHAEVRVEKPGDLLSAEVELTSRGDTLRYVSRGGLKLEGALQSFAFDVQSLRCLDVGASTGGFTDCLLQRGAAAVVAVDVGYGQLAHKLREDPRVRVMERTNARTLTTEDIGGAVDLAVVDASFIGLEKLADAFARCVRAGGVLIALVKPQFEVGREAASKNRGVIRDHDERARAIDGAAMAIQAAGFHIQGRADCVLPGPKGNVEAFVYAVRQLPKEG
jgi:23S rRNA (cytidine1920-2'-O)/16S rRNA (cytidine1409-2'-O)-methyltransferase